MKSKKPTYRESHELSGKKHVDDSPSEGQRVITATISDGTMAMYAVVVDEHGGEHCRFEGCFRRPPLPMSP